MEGGDDGKRGTWKDDEGRVADEWKRWTGEDEAWKQDGGRDDDRDLKGKRGTTDCLGYGGRVGTTIEGTK